MNNFENLLEQDASSDETTGDPMRHIDKYITDGIGNYVPLIYNKYSMRYRVSGLNIWLNADEVENLYEVVDKVPTNGNITVVGAKII